MARKKKYFVIRDAKKNTEQDGVIGKRRNEAKEEINKLTHTSRIKRKIKRSFYDYELPFYLYM